MKPKIPRNFQREAEASISHQAHTRPFRGRCEPLEAGNQCADILMLRSAMPGGVNGMMAEILDEPIRLHRINRQHEMDSAEDLALLIALGAPYLK